MSLNQIINPVQRLNLKCGVLDITGLVSDNPITIDELEFKAQNSDVINLSSLPDKGTGGYVLTSDGDGNLSWTAGGSSGSVNYNGVIPVQVGKIALYNATNGTLINESSLTETDLTTLQTDVVTLQTDVGTLQTDVGTLQTDVGTLQTDVGTLQTNVSTLQSKTQNITTVIPNSTTFTGNIACNVLNSNSVNNAGTVGTNNLFTQSISPIGSFVLMDGDLNFSNVYKIMNLNKIILGTIEGVFPNNITVNSNLDFQNTYNLLNISGINGIKPSGGVYSESPTAVLAGIQTDTNLFGLGTPYGSATVPGGGFKAGDCYSLKVGGQLTCDNNDNFSLVLKSSSGAIFGTFNITFDLAQSDAWWELEVEFIIRTIGVAATASISTNGNFGYFNNNGIMRGIGINNTNNTTFDTTISNTIQLLYTTTQVSITAFTASQISITKLF